MKLLLDTHIWVWSQMEPQHLSRRVARELQSPENELWLSPISIWELLVLCGKGRIVLDEDVAAWIAKAMHALPLRDAPVTHEIALETRRTGLSHRDPADQFLVATARVFELALVTADDRLIRARNISVLANR